MGLKPAIMFIDHFYFQLLLKQKVSMDPVQNGESMEPGSMFCVHVTNHPELVPEFVIKTIILLNNVYLHLVYCSFLRLYFLSFEGDMHPVHYRGSMGPWA